MIPDRIKYTKEFSYHGISEWLGVEGSLEPGETIMDGLLQARQKVIETFNESLKEVEVPVLPQSEKPKREQQIDGFRKAILSCTEIEGAAGLKTFEFLLTKFAELKPIYDNKLNSLQNG